MSYIKPAPPYDFRLGMPTKLYKVSVPIVATYSPEEIELFGLPVSYEDDEDNYNINSYKERTTVMVNINKILDMYQDGYRIYLVDTNNVYEIYDILTRYIEYKSNNTITMLNQELHVEDDARLRLIDRFLGDVFQIHKLTIVKNNAAKDTAYRTIHNIMGSGSFLNKNTNRSNTSTDNVVDVHYVQYNAPEVDLSHIRRERQIKYHNNITSEFLKD